jgi:hypothetical protein
LCDALFTYLLKPEGSSVDFFQLQQLVLTNWMFCRFHCSCTEKSKQAIKRCISFESVLCTVTYSAPRWLKVSNFRPQNLGMELSKT